jgi:hypothetical protein
LIRFLDREVAMVRAVLALVAAGWFAYNAIEFLPTPFAYLNPGQAGGIDGDAGAVAVTWAARALFAGLAVLSLAIPDWSLAIRKVFGDDHPAPAHDIRER